MGLALNWISGAVFVLEQLRGYQHPLYKSHISMQPQVTISPSADINTVSIYFLVQTTVHVALGSVQPFLLHLHTFIQQSHRISSVEQTGPALPDPILAQ